MYISNEMELKNCIIEKFFKFGTQYINVNNAVGKSKGSKTAKHDFFVRIIVVIAIDVTTKAKNKWYVKNFFFIEPSNKAKNIPTQNAEQVLYRQGSIPTYGATTI